MVRVAEAGFVPRAQTPGLSSGARGVLMSNSFELIAAQAKSLRAELLRGGIRPATSVDFANLIELLELLTTQILIELEMRAGARKHH